MVGDQQPKTLTDREVTNLSVRSSLFYPDKDLSRFRSGLLRLFLEGLDSFINRENGPALRTFHLRFLRSHPRAAKGKGRHKRHCQNQANQLFHSPSPPFFFQIKFRIPKGNISSRSFIRTPSESKGKEDMDTLANYVFLVKEKIQQKNQGENGFSAL
jgi:hypothetical protein